MTSHMATGESLMRSRIDRLVSGELGEHDRQELLAWLEADAARWRSCALAFLEAQVWEEALGERSLGSGVSGQGLGIRGQESEDREHLSVSREQRPAARWWIMPLAAVALSIAAFGCGMWWRGITMSPDPPGGAIVEHSDQAPQMDKQVPRVPYGPLLASVPVKGGPLGNVPAVLQFPVLPPEAATGEAPAVSEHVRREWERRGYEVKEERRYLPAKLPDGRQVMVPVNEVKMKFVGRRAS